PIIHLGWKTPLSTTTLAPSPSSTQLTGRTDGDLIVMFDGDESLVGSIVEVAIEKHAPLALFGRLAATPVLA
ncbi:MAG: TRAM domain-containing protein, partial [Phycisphaeraceae bacterium]